MRPEVHMELATTFAQDVAKLLLRCKTHKGGPVTPYLLMQTLNAAPGPLTERFASSPQWTATHLLDCLQR